MIKRILVPLDGSPIAERALLVAGDLAESLAATLVIARVVAMRPQGTHYRPHLIDELTEAESQEAQAYLASTAGGLRRDRLSVETVLLHGEPVQALAATALEERCDLIALTSHGISGLASHVFGSVTQKLLHCAPCPVLVVRCTPQDIEREEEREEQDTDRVFVEQLAAAGIEGRS